MEHFFDQGVDLVEKSEQAWTNAKENYKLNQLTRENRIVSIFENAWLKAKHKA